MMSRADNDRLCRIGPGTPMGAVFRRFWLPICTSDRVPLPGGAPRFERLLGENFVVFRNGEGQVGVLDELCPHRGASLSLGRVEDCGIRCIYHGWKIGNDGTLLEVMKPTDCSSAPSVSRRASKRWASPGYGPPILSPAAAPRSIHCSSSARSARRPSASNWAPA